MSLAVAKRSGRTASKIIAASNTPAHLKRYADYICDGTEDQEEIKAAINSILNMSNAWEHYGSETTVVIPEINFPFIWKDSSTGTYHAYGADAGNDNILHATSSDGISWTMDTTNNPMLSLGTAGAWDDSDITCPPVWKEGATWYMLYRGNGSKVGLATASAPEGPWTKYASNPVINDGIAADPAGIIKVGSTYYLYTNTTGTDREVNYYTSTDLHTWTLGIGNPIFTGGRYCSCPFVYNSTYYLLVSRYFNHGAGGVLELWSSPSPTMKEGQRKFLGVVVYDENHPSVDTPSVVTSDITRVFSSGTDQFWCYYAKKLVTGGITYPGFLCQPGTVTEAITQGVIPRPGKIFLQDGTYSITIPSATYYYIDVPYGIIIEGNNPILQLAAGTTLSTWSALFVIDNGSTIRNCKIDGNKDNVASGSQMGVLVANGGLIDNCEVYNWNTLGAYLKGEFRGGKIYRNKNGARTYKRSRIVDTDIVGNGLSTSDYNVLMYANSVLYNCQVRNSRGRGIGIFETKALIDSCTINENEHYGVEISAGKSVTIKNSHLHDNKGYSNRGQISLAGILNMTSCLLTDYQLANTSQVYSAAGATAIIGDCLVKGGVSGIVDNTSGGIITYNINAPL